MKAKHNEEHTRIALRRKQLKMLASALVGKQLNNPKAKITASIPFPIKQIF